MKVVRKLSTLALGLADVDFVHDGYKGNWAKHLLKQVDAYHDGHKQQKKKRKLGKRGAA